jgi:7-cyano-7-deazaguanine synthase
MTSNKKALVIFSGGQDSTTALYWAKKHFYQVEAITFDYSQRHHIEIDCAIKIAQLSQTKHQVVKTDFFQTLTSSALTTTQEITQRKDNDLPTTFVPGRNLIFAMLSASYAYDQNIRDIVLGVSQVDYSGYPDCREETILSLQQTISLGLDTSFTIHTPLIHKNKKDTVLLAKELGILDVMKYTHTCYHGQRPPCGKCPACILRAKGFQEAGELDRLEG